jgi:hypothetical protein
VYDRRKEGRYGKKEFFFTFFYFFSKKSCFLDNIAIYLYISVFKKKESGRRPAAKIVSGFLKEGPWKQ